MMQTVMLETGTEIRGDAMLPVLYHWSGRGDPHALANALRLHGFHKINPNGWYSLQGWLNVLKTVYNNGYHNLFEGIGAEIAAHTPLPTGVTLPAMIEMLDMVYQSYFRCGDVGRFVVERLDARSYHVVARVPFPEELTFGLLSGLCRAADTLDAPVQISRQPGSSYLISW